MAPNILSYLTAWVELSDLGFHELKERLGVPDEYSFNIASIGSDGDEALEAELSDPVGAAAFMLRRMQAIRFLAHRSLTVERLELLLSYVTDLGYYLEGLLDEQVVEGSPILSGLRSLTLQLADSLSELPSELIGTPTELPSAT